jgi:hypothetical protein
MGAVQLAYRRAGVPYFRLIVSPTAVSYCSESELEFSNHRYETDHIRNPEAISEASGNPKEARDRNPNNLKGSHILIGTVSPRTQILLIYQFGIFITKAIGMVEERFWIGKVLQ